MRAIDKIASRAREKVRSAYDQVISWGKSEGRVEGREEERFQVFKKGLKKGFSLEDLIELTEVPEKTAHAWYALLKDNPDAELTKG
jgi:hypothetical protein